MADSAVGRWNIGIGLGLMVLFMLYGFFLIYMRDFAPGREAWIAGANVSPHFEARLAHAHGNLFSLLNIVFGALLLWLPVRPRRARWISVLALIGLLMPIGILSEIYLGLPPVLVLLGAVSITAGTALFALELIGMDVTDSPLS
ncbi:hypothetical protein [Haloplanus aerogenes]|uniref:Uncharacterized protein n=1 Tax=Haloplanus aerogenes TaxID=660522 RepID=A0A3M0CQ57_9EURY|nr:hypothetical protein [Haloplanus aerogenes]RMB11684.1 hypothetical protein ATH50_3384 [Haloplanus aerogenes]